MLSSVWKEGFRADLSKPSEGRSDIRDLFAIEDGNLGRTHLSEQTIDTGSTTPVKQAPRRPPPFKRNWVDRQLSELLAQGLIEPSKLI